MIEAHPSHHSHHLSGHLYLVFFAGITNALTSEISGVIVLLHNPIGSQNCIARHYDVERLPGCETKRLKKLNLNLLSPHIVFGLMVQITVQNE